MKYLVISVISIAGILALSLRNSSPNSDLEKVEARPVDLDQNLSAEHTEFNEYWYAGLAEITGYELKQSRYGEIHDGTAAMIFVTEPFSKKKQVKLDNPGAAGKDNLSVLKLNSTRKFLTGIYPYSMMTSVFSPINTEKYQNAVKVSLSGQEWCGHVFQQANLQGNKYQISAFSYFESEGDVSIDIPKAFMEDEIFNLIRMSPELLPIGNFEMIPSSVASRLLHQDFKPYTANASIGEAEWNGAKVRNYSISYPHNSRSLKIYFQAEFPHMIEGWEDSYKGIGGNMLTSTAIRKNTKKLPYWSLHNNKDRGLNAELYQ